MIESQFLGQWLPVAWQQLEDAPLLPFRQLFYTEAETPIVAAVFSKRLYKIDVSVYPGIKVYC